MLGRLIEADTIGVAWLAVARQIVEEGAESACPRDLGCGPIDPKPLRASRSGRRTPSLRSQSRR